MFLPYNAAGARRDRARASATADQLIAAAVESGTEVTDKMVNEACAGRTNFEMALLTAYIIHHSWTNTGNHCTIFGSFMRNPMGIGAALAAALLVKMERVGPFVIDNPNTHDEDEVEAPA